MSVAVECEDPVRWGVIDDGVGIESGGKFADLFVGFEIEHDHGLVIARGGETVAARLSDCRAVRSVDSCDFAQERSFVFIDDHDAILARDEDAMVGRVGHDVVPTAVATECVGVGDPVSRRLCEQCSSHCQPEKQGAFTHGRFLISMVALQYE